MTDADISREADRLLTPELASALHRAKVRCNAGVISTLEATIEIIEALQAFAPGLLVPPIVEAYDDFKAGNNTAFSDLLEEAEARLRCEKGIKL